MKIKPQSKQLDFLNWEIGAFFHFGIRTFYEGHKDWDNVHMEAAAFNPVKLDCNQWLKAAAAGGAKYAVLVAKHHDGFANWPSKYTEYSVKNTPWKNGGGDIVKEFTDACRKNGMKAGIYYSPAQFGYKEMNGREYDDYFINQISELLTNYGKIDYLWFDGCGSEGHEYDRVRIIDAIRSLQPEILIFNMWDPDTRWVGNEDGIAAFDERNEITGTRLSVIDAAVKGETRRFLPYECDCRIRRENWFYSENDAHLLRSAEDIMGLYRYSVGRGGNLLINFAPDRNGLIPEEDCRVFAEFGERLKKQFEKPAACSIKRKGNTYNITLDKPGHINCMVLKENLENGEGILEFALYHELGYEEKSYVKLFEGKTVGHMRICDFPKLYTKNLMLEITDANGDFELNGIKLYNIK